MPILSVWTKGKAKAHQDVISNLPRQGNNANDQWKIMEDLELMYKGWLEQYGKNNPKPNILEQTYTF